MQGRLKNDARQFISFQTIASVPCFELWLLLHYEDVQAPLHRDEVLRRLRQHYPSYVKGAINAYAATRANLDIATQRAERLATKFTAESDPEPFTSVAELVKRLTTLRA